MLAGRDREMVGRGWVERMGGKRERGEIKGGRGGWEGVGRGGYMEKKRRWWGRGG